MLASKLNTRTESIYITDKVLELLVYLNFFYHRGYSKLNNEKMKPASDFKA